MDDAVSIGIYRAFLENECSVREPIRCFDIPFYLGYCLGGMEDESGKQPTVEKFQVSVDTRELLKP